MYKFIVENTVYEFPSERIPKGSLLETLIFTENKVEKIDDAYVLNLSQEEFLPVYDYFVKDVIPSKEDLDIFDYLNIDLTSYYELSLVKEEDIRKNMYSENSGEYSYPYHNLIRVDENFWKEFTLGFSSEKEVLNFGVRKLVKNSWREIQENLKILQPFFKSRIFIAGGSIFSILFGQKINDIDVFPYDCSEKEAKETILNIRDELCPNAKKEKEFYFNLSRDREFPRELSEDELINYVPDGVGYLPYSQLQHLSLDERLRFYARNFRDSPYLFKNEGSIDIKTPKVLRTENAITFIKRKFPYDIQVILRLYQTPSEVIHGFDLDSCCMGYDGKNIWMTPRCFYSLKMGYNTVNFDRLSPSYETRLVKYAVKGMGVKIPRLDREKVNWGNIEADFKENFKIHPKRNNFSYKYKFLQDLKGVDILLYFYILHQRVKMGRNLENSMEKLDHERSDYNPVSLRTTFRQSMNVSKILEDFDEKFREEKIPEEFNNQIIEKHLKSLDDRAQKIFDERMKTFDGGNPKDNHLRSVHLGPDYPFRMLLGETSLRVNTFNEDRQRKDINLIYSFIHNLEDILEIDEDVYIVLGGIKPWKLSREIKFKVTSPGEQMTNTFNRLVLTNNKVWFEGKYYA